VSDMHVTKFYRKPDFWRGDAASFTSAVKQAATDIKTQIANPDNFIFATWGNWLAHVILENRRGEAIEERSPWDYSTRGRPSNESFDLTEYETIGDFLDNELTGNTRATFCSGSGFAAETYASVFTEESWKMYGHCIREIAPKLAGPEDGSIEDEVIDALSTEGVADYEMEEAFRRLPLQETFFRNMGKALEERNQERLQNEIDANADSAKKEAIRQLAGTELPMVIQNFSGATKWEWQNHKGLWNFLDALVEEHGVEKVAAALVFVRINTSTKVAFELKVRYAASK
jgi:hypothetical protein